MLTLVSRRWMSLGIALLAVALCASDAALLARAAPAQDFVIQIVEDENPDVSASPSPSPSPSPDDPRRALIDAVVRLTNAERTTAGLAPLQPNDSLMSAAQSYAAVLAPGACFEHTCPPVTALRDRFANAGYTDWSQIGENIAAGNTTPESVVEAWMRSPGHRENILEPNYQEIGVGVLNGDGKYRIYWVQEFGRRWK
jgi:uncharacterized protein YkwD